MLLDIVMKYSEQWRFQWNVAKSKVVIFRGRGQLQEGDSFFLGLSELEVVEQIKYLG